MHSSTAAGRDLRRRPLNGINLMNGVNSSNRRDRNIDRISCATINSRPMMSRDALHGHSKGMGRSPRRRIAKLRCVVTYHRHRTNHTTSAVRITRRMVTAAVTAGLILTEKTCAISSALQVGNLTADGIAYSLNATSSWNPFTAAANNVASAIVVSVDGKGVYVGGERGGLVHLSRNELDGSLTVVKAWAASDFDEAIQSVEQILVAPDGSKLVTLGSRGSSTGTFGVFRFVAGVTAQIVHTAGLDDINIGLDGDLDLLFEDDHRGILRGEFPLTSSRDLYVVDDDQNALTHYVYSSGRFAVSQTIGSFSCAYGLGVSPDGLNVYVTDDCLYTASNYKRDPLTGSLSFVDELRGASNNGDGLGCLKCLSFSDSGMWAVGLDSCDNVLSILARDVSTGTLTPTEMVAPVNPNGNSLNADQSWNVLVISDGSGDIYVSDWADRYVLWIRADFGVGGDGSVHDMEWYSLDFKPSALAVSPDLKFIYATNKEISTWTGGVFSRVAVITEAAERGSDSEDKTALIAALTSCLVFAVVVAVSAGWYVKRKREITKYASEEETLRAALEANPDDAVAHNNLGYLMETVYKDYKEAEACYREALRLNPRAAFAHNSLGHLLHHRQKNFELAEEHYRKAISLQWRSPDAHYNLGCLLQHHKDDMAGAEEQYRSAIKCDPKHGMAQYNLGWVLEKVKEDLPGAEKCYYAALEADPDDKDASRRLAKVVAVREAEAQAKEDEANAKQQAKRAPRSP